MHSKHTLRTVFAAIALLLAGAVILYAGFKAADGRSTERELKDLWKKYEAAQASDRPAAQLDILTEIKAAAAKRHLALDWYDACVAYKRVAAGINWKLRDSLQRQLSREMEDFGEPVLPLVYSFADAPYYLQKKGLDYVRANSAALKASFNPALQSKDSRFGDEMGALLLKDFQNDYNYALWAILKWDYDEETEAELRAYLKGSQPQTALLDFLSPDSGKDSYAAYLEKYKGSVYALLAGNELLSRRFSALQPRGSSEQFKALRASCDSLKAEAARFKGADREVAALCHNAEEIATALDSKSVDFMLEDLVLSVYARNISKVDVCVRKDGKEVYRGSVASSAKPYYAPDTLKLQLPDKFDDGDYSVECSSGQVSRSEDWSRRNLSVSLQQRSDAYYIYVCTQKEGRPVGDFEYSLSRERNRSIYSGKGNCSKGYFRLPDGFADFVSNEKSNVILSCKAIVDGRVRLSETLSPSRSLAGKESKLSEESVILSDCSAYRPGDRLGFKAILYTQDGDGNRATVPAGRSCEMALYDSEMNMIESRPLKTNDFGSVFGEFSLPVGKRGGMWSLRLSSSGHSLGVKLFRLDEFTLPEYVLEFAERKGACIAGDTATVRGSVSAYSGHVPGNALLRWSAAGQEGETLVADDGSFVFSFKTDGGSAWNRGEPVTVRLCPASGQTLEFSTMVNVVAKMRLIADIPSSVEDSLVFSLAERSFLPENVRLEWVLEKDGKRVKGESFSPGSRVECDLSSLSDGVYILKIKALASSASGRELKTERSWELVKLSSSCESVDFPVSAFLRKTDGDAIGCQMVDSEKELWAVVQLWEGPGRELRHELVKLSGKCGDRAAVKNLSWEWKDYYPDVVWLSVFYFRDGASGQQTFSYRRPRKPETMDLRFVSLKREWLPSSNCRINLSCSVGSEVAATVFDLATETIMPNRWTAPKEYVPYFRFNAFSRKCCGSDRLSPRIVPVYSMSKSLSSRAVLANGAALEEGAVVDDSVEESFEEEAIPFQLVNNELLDTKLRSSFLSRLCFEPCLRPDADGNLSFSFNSSDRLSSYAVQLYAHDRDMNCASIRETILITLPLKLTLMPPACLYEGDSWRIRAELSSTASGDMSGYALLSLFAGGSAGGAAGSDGSAGKDALFQLRLDDVRVAAGSSVALDFGTLPQEIYASLAACGADSLGVRLDFVSSEGATEYLDAVFHSIPVRPSFQTITEAHSAVLLAGADRDSLLAVLCSRFTNSSPYGAEYSEHSLAEMLREAVPDFVNPENDNAISLVNALYVNALSARLKGAGVPDGVAAPDAELLARLKRCACPQGGFSWFEGMDASPSVTAMVLFRMARAGIDSELGEEIRSKACAFLDREQFASKGKRPWWYGGISLENYLLVRSMYADLPLAASPDRESRKEISNFLVPRKKRGLNGAVLQKAERLYILMNLASGQDGKSQLSGQDGKSLAASLGIRVASAKRIYASISADYASLAEYAQRHDAAGCYYPNAVMPWRGLMESEAFAHSLLCDLMDRVPEYVDSRLRNECASIADGIRIWLMLQKESQVWDADPSYVDAIASVLRGSDSVLDTRVAVLSKSSRKPFAEIRPAGNGFTISLTYKKVRGDGSLAEISEGDELAVGDKIVAEYSVWSAENRSFVRLKMPRPACLVPQNQLSGVSRPTFVPSGIARYSFTPFGYRWVRPESSEYWFESFPEEKVCISETLFVNSAGRFSAPAPEIECLYAPHYRANYSAGTVSAGL